MIDIDSIRDQVKHNCNISDARFWGFYSPCGLLLRMRKLYMAENDLMPWDSIDDQHIREWIDARESLWYELEDKDFEDITIEGINYRPFDVRGINSVLNKEGYFYGAGIGDGMKPVFLLAELRDSLRIGKYEVIITGRELARDLSSNPAMIQGKSIIARTSSLTFYFWDKYEEMKALTCGRALEYAFAEYGIHRASSPQEVYEKFERMINNELLTLIYHEIGEATLDRIMGRWWRRLLQEFAQTREELILRAIRDVLADTCGSGTLKYIIKEKRTGSLGFYIAFLGGFRSIIFPEIMDAFNEFMNSNEEQRWDIIEKARAKGYKKAKTMVSLLRNEYKKGTLTGKLIQGLIRDVSFNQIITK